MKQIIEMDPDSVELLCLDFTATIQVFDQMETVELKTGGANIDVCKDNLEEYVQLQMKRLLFDQQREQLNAMLVGLYEVVPQHLIQVFDYQELELMLNGLPQIDLADWKTHTEYKGQYTNDHQVIQWFWQTVSDFTVEERAKLLQFTTGAT
jgi:hypothetical protein